MFLAEGKHAKVLRLREFVTWGKGSSCATGAGVGSGRGWRNGQRPDHFSSRSAFIAKGGGEAPLKVFKQGNDLGNTG